MKQEVKRFFEANVEAHFQSLILSGIEFGMISEEAYCNIIALFTEKEVKEEVWGCDANKSLGPDGFNLNFIKNCWEMVKKDTLGFLGEFHATALMPKAIPASFLALIPMKTNPQELPFRKLILTFKIKTIYSSKMLTLII